jgi:membrane protease YdiL (CAAX protease family)
MAAILLSKGDKRNMARTTTIEGVSLRPLMVMTSGAVLPYLAGSALVMALRTDDVMGRPFVDPEVFFQWIPWVLTAAALGIFLWALWMIRKDKLKLTEVGLDSPGILGDIVTGVVGGAVLWLLMALTYQSVGFLSGTPLTAFPVMFPALPALCYLVVSSLSAEFTYRGYGLNLLRRRSGGLWALLVTALLSGAAAWTGGWQDVAVWLMMGLMLGLIALGRNGSMLPSLIARMIAVTMLWAMGSPFMLLGIM